MNQLFRRSVPCLVAKTTGLPYRLSRAVTYEVSPTGEKIVVNVIEGKNPKKKEKWQQIRPMGHEKQLKRIKLLEMNERLESDPKVARKTAFSKLQSLKDSLRNRGFSRETKPYNPPEEVESIVQSVCRQVLSENKNQNWTLIPLNDRVIKFKFLTKCAKELNCEIPNSQLYLMKTVADVLQFYSTPIRGLSSYDEMVRNADNLPPNLHVIPEPIMYRQESDTFFGGINAYPFSTYRISGLRAKKKYTGFKKPFVWPDV